MVDDPFLLQYYAQADVKVDGWLVPVQYGPFETPAVIIAGMFGQINKEGFADALAQVGGLDKEVFKINSGAAQKSGKIIKIESESSRRPPGRGTDRLSRSSC